MKALKNILKITLVLAGIAAALFAVIVYLDKIKELFERREELKNKAVDNVKGTFETIKGKSVDAKDKAVSGVKDTANALKEKLPTKEELLGKLPTKEELIRLNPFRKAEIEAEFADYADVD